MLRRFLFLLGASVAVALAAFTALVIVGAGLVDPLLADERVDAVRGAILALDGLALGCLVATVWLSRGATGGQPG